jgi:hypothetical protein
VFSFGVTLFEIATTGEIPFSKRSDAEVKQFYLEGQNKYGFLCMFNYVLQRQARQSSSRCSS